MDLEELSKSQIILLTLLVSFITSMATGIVTVSMMGKAPPTIAETVNRVIQQTIQKVDPPASAAASAITSTHTNTVVVHDSDLIAQAVKKVSPSIVRVYSNEKDSPTFLGLGLVIDSSGLVATDKAALGGVESATVKLADGTSVRAYVTTRDAHSGMVYLTASSTQATGKPVWVPIATGSAEPSLGQTVFALAGENTLRIGDGIVTTVSSQPDLSAPGLLETNVADNAIMFGSPLVNSIGQVVGVSTEVSRSSSPTAFIPMFVSQSSVATSTKEKAPNVQ